MIRSPSHPCPCPTKSCDIFKGCSDTDEERFLRLVQIRVKGSLREQIRSRDKEEPHGQHFKRTHSGSISTSHENVMKVDQQEHVDFPLKVSKILPGSVVADVSYSHCTLFDGKFPSLRGIRPCASI